MEKFWYFSNSTETTPAISIDAHKGGLGVRSEKLSHKNAIKHEKGPPRFSDKPKYPPQ
jgi:hypothetical protein